MFKNPYAFLRVFATSREKYKTIEWLKQLRIWVTSMARQGYVLVRAGLSNVVKFITLITQAGFWRIYDAEIIAPGGFALEDVDPGFHNRKSQVIPGFGSFFGSPGRT